MELLRLIRLPINENRTSSTRVYRPLAGRLIALSRNELPDLKGRTVILSEVSRAFAFARSAGHVAEVSLFDFTASGNS